MKRHLLSVLLTLSVIGIKQPATAAPEKWVKGTCSNYIADSLPTYYSRCTGWWTQSQNGISTIKAIKITPGLPYKDLYFEEGKNAYSSREKECLYVSNGARGYGVCMLINEHGKAVQMFSDNPY